MRDADGFREEIKNSQPAEDSLKDDRRDGDPPQFLQPGSFFDALQPDGQDHREKSDSRCDHPVAVFIKNAAFHGRHYFSV